VLLTYRDLENELVAAIVCDEGIENGRKSVGIEFYCFKLSASSSHHAQSSWTNFRWFRSLLALEEFSNHSPSTTAPMT
jgi:hypothetical protein